jgi:hypothetical protein
MPNKIRETSADEEEMVVNIGFHSAPGIGPVFRSMPAGQPLLVSITD